MLKLISKLVCLAVISLIAFLVLSLTSGGEKFRWFGKKVGQESEKVGKTADAFKKKGDEVLRGIEKTKEKIDDLTGKKDEETR